MERPAEAVQARQAPYSNSRRYPVILDGTVLHNFRAPLRKQSPGGVVMNSLGIFGTANTAATAALEIVVVSYLHLTASNARREWTETVLYARRPRLCPHIVSDPEGGNLWDYNARGLFGTGTVFVLKP
jgi:hypothetical protein